MDGIIWGMRLKSGFWSKKLIVFDLDGTLTPTKAPIHEDMSRLLRRLLLAKKVAIIGGGRYEQFIKQYLRYFKCPKGLLGKIFLFPTTATSFYRHKNGWKKVYRLELSARERRQIKKAFREVLKEMRYAPPKKVYGKVIEDRRTQITFSALGQDVVARLGEKKGVRLKEEWKRGHTDVKMKIARMMQKRLPGFAVQAAGFTSVDITQKGVDKAYGIRQIEKHLRMPIKDMLFVGDAIFPGGNDYAIVKTGVDYVKVSGPGETKKLIRFLLKK